ncbi:MAG: hypothetical protein ACI9R3_003223 [Verrucomicrobiales bacterium]
MAPASIFFVEKLCDLRRGSNEFLLKLVIFDPLPKLAELVARQLLNGFFNFHYRCHACTLAVFLWFVSRLCSVIFCVDELQLVDAHFGVDLSGFELIVAEELMDEADVGAVIVHVSGAAVANEMATAGAIDVCLLDELSDHAAQDRVV